MSIERVDEYILLAKRKQELEAELREVKGKLEKTETRLTDYFAEKGLKNLRTENGMAYLSREIFAGLTPEEDGGHEAAHAALRQQRPGIHGQGRSERQHPPGLRPGAGGGGRGTAPGPAAPHPDYRGVPGPGPELDRVTE